MIDCLLGIPVANKHRSSHTFFIRKKRYTVDHLTFTNISFLGFFRYIFAATCRMKFSTGLYSLTSLVSFFPKKKEVETSCLCVLMHIVIFVKGDAKQ